MHARFGRLKLKKGSIRSRTVLFVLATCASVALLLVTSFFFWYRQAAIRDYRQLVHMRLSDTDAVFNNYLDGVNAQAYTWFSSPAGMYLMATDSYNVVENINFYYQVRDALKYSPYIQSVYFINNRGEIPLWVKGEGQFTEDLDDMLREHLYLLPMQKSPFAWNVKHRYTGARVPLLSLFVSEAPYGANHYTGSVVVNIDLRELRKRMLSSDGVEPDSIYVIDENGTVILHNDASFIGDDWSDRDSVRNALSQPGAIFRGWEDSSAYEYMSIQSRRAGFRIISQTESVGWAVNTSGLVTFLLVLLFSVSVLAVIAIILVSTRLFRPLSTIIDDLRQSAPAQIANRDRDEVKFLRNYFSQLTENLQDLREKGRLDLIAHNLAHDDSSEDVQPLLISNGVLDKDRAYRAVTVLFTDSHDAFDMQLVDQMRLAIQRLYQGTLAQLGKCTSFEWGLRNLFFLVSEAPDMRIDEGEVYQLCLRAAREAGQATGAAIYTVISARLDSGACECKPVFKANSDRLHLMWTYGDGGVFTFAEPRKHIRPGEATVEGALALLKQGDREGFLGAVRGMVHEARDATYTEFASWIQDVSERILEVKAAANPGSAAVPVNELHEKVRLIESLDALQRWFEYLYDDVAEKMEQVKRGTAADSIEEAVDFIRTHYDDDRLGAVMLSERLHISAPYFGQLFREFTGSSITDYILRVRMEKARDYLVAEPSMEIAKVAVKVGYASSSYFATVFKKYYGVSPSKLRNSLHISEE